MSWVIRATDITNSAREYYLGERGLRYPNMNNVKLFKFNSKLEAEFVMSGDGKFGGYKFDVYEAKGIP